MIGVYEERSNAMQGMVLRPTGGVTRENFRNGALAFEEVEMEVKKIEMQRRK